MTKTKNPHKPKTVLEDLIRHGYRMPSEAWGEAWGDRPRHERPEAVKFDLAQWANTLRQDLRQLFTHEHAKTEAIAQELAEIQIWCKKLDDRVCDLEASEDRPYTTMIASLAPRPFRVLQGIPVLVEPRYCEELDDVEYLVSISEAGIATSGDTLEEAVENLKGRLVAAYRKLSSVSEEKLGPMLAQRWTILRTFIEAE